jgi:hypothetical protein
MQLRAGHRWIVRCRDESGHRVRIEVWAGGSEVLLSVSGHEVAMLPGLAVGRLREALRAAAIQAGLATVDPPFRPVGPPPTAARPRQRVSLRTPPGALRVSA